MAKEFNDYLTEALDYALEYKPTGKEKDWPEVKEKMMERYKENLDSNKDNIADSITALFVIAKSVTGDASYDFHEEVGTPIRKTTKRLKLK